MDRRRFARSAALSSGALSPAGRLLAALAADNLHRKNFGIQLYTLRDALRKDAAGILKAVAKAGYRQVEPYGFADCQPLLDGAKDADGAAPRRGCKGGGACIATSSRTTRLIRWRASSQARRIPVNSE